MSLVGLTLIENGLLLVWFKVRVYVALKVVYANMATPTMNRMTFPLSHVWPHS